jgi:hypothetical protein
MQPSDFLASFGRDFGSPRPRPTSMQELVLSRPRMLLPTRSASETGHRLPARPGSFEERQGPPGLLGRPLRARHGRTPRRIRPLLAPTSLREDLRRGRRRLQAKQNPRHPERHSFRGRIIPRLTRSRAYASPISLPRPSPGSLPARAGSPLAGRVSHPLDDKANFMESSHILQSQSTSRAWSH